MSRWFRFYAEVVNDPKVQKLPCEDFRAWVNLLCLASENGGKIPPLNDVAFSLRMSVDAASTVLERLSSGGLIDRMSGGPDGWHYAPHSWDKRQYKSDTSTARVKRFRERSENVSETPPETEADTEQKKKDKTTSYPKKSVELFDDFWKAYPNKKAKPQALKAYAKALEKTDHATLVAAVHAQRGWRTWIDGFVPHPATWLNAERWTDEPESPRVAQRQNAGSSGRGDTSFADVIARRRREREQGMDISGGQETVSGDGCNWSEGAIEGVVTGGHSEGRNGHDLDFPF